MERRELIESDEYIQVTIECIVRSGKSVKQTRKELEEAFIKLRDDLFEEQPLKEDEQDELWDEIIKNLQSEHLSKQDFAFIKSALKKQFKISKL